MSRKATITINQTESDLDFKAMLQDLRRKEDPGNPYSGRSESTILKMILRKVLREEHDRICGQPMAASN
jgi:hypothetical protein